VTRRLPTLGLLALVAGIAPAHAEDAPAARALHLPLTPYSYAAVELPAHYRDLAVRRLDNTPTDNPVTDDGATLGRVLFYDTRLSANGTVACAACHQQKHAFSDPARFSKGYEGKFTDRNAMPLVDVRYYPRGRFFWDERARTLEEQVLQPIQNKVEMGHDVNRVVEALGQDTQYAELYRRAFGDAKVTSDRTAKALAQFVRSLVSYRSKYDEGLAKMNSVGTDFPNFTREENRGKASFLRNCGQCHLPGGQGAVFVLNAPQNNGLDLDGKVADLGVADVTFNRFDAGRFKSPSLRNVEHTGPYMHDGRFKTLEEVIEHYSTGVKNHPNLDPRLRGAGRGGLQLPPPEKAALVAFLKTLSDPAFLTDPRFADPFAAK
jgi:cytochrome c peroxidase